MSSKRALIFGISGQDGTYLSRLLLSKNYTVFGVTRSLANIKGKNLWRLGIESAVEMVELDQLNYLSVFNTLSTLLPDEIYCLAGQSSVSYSFQHPIETFESNVMGLFNVLEASRHLKRRPRIYNAGSSECFGDTVGQKANETTSFNPLSPYGVSKASSFWLVKNYRECYSMFVCTGILFNHESPLRSDKFVTQKVISAVNRIRSGSNEVLELGALDVYRDWGWAPEYVEVMWRMLQIDVPQDFVIATGETNSLESFVDVAFGLVNLDWRVHVNINNIYSRPSDIKYSCGDSTLAKRLLNWEAKYKMKDVISFMLSGNW